MIGPAAFDHEPVELVDQMTAAISRVLRAPYRILGPEVEAFENQWAITCGVRHAVGVANGMDAIEIALRALKIGPGDEVITTPMTAFATVLAILRSGATPVLADIDPATAIMSLDSVHRCLTPRTRAVVLVHLYGYLTEMEPWLQLTSSHGVHLIEDCAQAHLAERNGHVAGSFGVAGAFSFYPTKNLGAIGDAGALVTNDAHMSEAARHLRNYGQTERYRHDVLGLNSRLDEMQAAILTERLGWLRSFTSRRQAIAQRYRSEINNTRVTMLQPGVDGANVCHLFVLLTSHRDALQAFLARNDVATVIHYPIPVHHQEPAHDVRRDPSGLSHAEHHGRSCLSLPCHPQLSDPQVEQVISLVNEFTP